MVATQIIVTPQPCGEWAEYCMSCDKDKGVLGGSECWLWLSLQTLDGTPVPVNANLWWSMNRPGSMGSGCLTHYYDVPADKCVGYTPYVAPGPAKMPFTRTTYEDTVGTWTIRIEFGGKVDAVTGTVYDMSYVEFPFVVTSSLPPTCTEGEYRGPTVCWDGTTIYAERCVGGAWSPTGQTCSTQVCIEGEYANPLTCWDGSIIYTDVCQNNQWVASGQTCPIQVCVEGDFRSPQTCWDGSIIQTEECLDNQWVPTGLTCEPNPNENWQFIAFGLGGLLVMALLAQ